MRFPHYDLTWTGRPHAIIAIQANRGKVSHARASRHEFNEGYIVAAVVVFQCLDRPVEETDFRIRFGQDNHRLLDRIDENQGRGQLVIEPAGLLELQAGLFGFGGILGECWREADNEKQEKAK